MTSYLPYLQLCPTSLGLAQSELLLNIPFQTNLTLIMSFHMWQSCSRLPVHSSCPGCASLCGSVCWRITIKFKETSKYPMLLPGPRCQAKRAAGTSHWLHGLHGSETAFAVRAHPWLTLHHSTSLCEGLFILKEVKTHGDKSFGHGFMSATSSSLCFLANPLVRGISSPFHNSKVTQNSEEREGAEPVFYLAVRPQKHWCIKSYWITTTQIF